MPDSNQRSSIGEAMRWSSLVTSIGMELAVPTGVGAWLDNEYGTSPWLAVTGALVGMFLATQGLRRLMKELDK